VLNLQHLILELRLLPLRRKLRVDLDFLLRDPVRNALYRGLKLRRQRLDLLLRRLDLVVDLDDLGTKASTHRRTSPLNAAHNGQP
jgi:hypothetical protein